MLKYIKVKFQIEFKTETKFPLYKGSIFRGAFGKSLRDITCPIKKQKCSECILSNSCIYFSIFESRKKISEKTSPNRPLPFILEALDMCNNHFLPRDRLSFSIILIEDAIFKLPYVVYSIINMGEMGIGYGIKDGYGRFKLLSATTDDKILYSHEDNKLYKPQHINTIGLIEQDIQDVEVSKIKLDFLTPYRVKFRNKLVTTFDFSILIRACLRRISQLEDTYAGKEPDIDYKGLIKESQEIEATTITKKWFELKRYSFRQHREMKLGGLVGSVLYRGNLKKFLPILRYCEVMHVGKQTSFGFGKFKETLIF